MKSVIIAMLVMLVAGCSSGPKYNVTVDAATTKAPGSVKVRCDPIDKKMVKRAGEKNSVPMGDLLKSNDYLVGLYGECSTRDAAKADWIDSQGY